MKVQCTKCQSKYNIKDEKIPDAGAKIKCLKCQNVISVMKPEPEPPALSSEDLIEEFENESDKTEYQDAIEPETKKCPYCADEINVDAIKCKHCGSDLVEYKSAKTNKNSGELLGVLLLICPLLAIFLLWFIPFPFFHIIIIISTIIITAILAAVEASQLGFGQNKSGKKENGPVGLFFGIILMWIIGYPYYLYQRSKKGKKNLVAGGILVSLLFTSSVFGMNYGINGGMSSEISMVKNGTLANFPNKTIGEAIEGFMGNPHWDTILGNDGNKYVNVTGSISYMQEEVRAAIQYRLNDNDNSFQINALEFNGIPQNGLILAVLLDKMYSTSSSQGSSAASMSYKEKSNCVELESDAMNVLASIASYYSDPSHTGLPTVEDLKREEGLGIDSSPRISMTEAGDVFVIVYDKNTKCPKGEAYLSWMGGSGISEWISQY